MVDNKSVKKIDVIIAPFQIPEQPYRQKLDRRKLKDLMLNAFEISYIEVQVCLKLNKQYLLINKKIEKIL